MVFSLALDRTPALAWGYRTLFTGAVLVAMSAFAKETAAFTLDLPKPTNIHPAAGPMLAAPAVTIPVVKAARHRPSPLALLRTGLASWYGKVLHEHRTANGGHFDMFEMTAAHRTLPFGSKVKVTDLRNHRSVVVTITDRGALPGNRIIDLSYAAAEELGMIRTGVDPVRLDVLPKALLETAAVPTPPEP